MRKYANPTFRKRNINANKCINNINWAAAGIRNEIENGGYYLRDRNGLIIKDETGKRIFIKIPNIVTIKAYKEYADINFKMLRKVMPDANNEKDITPPGTVEEELLKQLAERLPD